MVCGLKISKKLLEVHGTESHRTGEEAFDLENLDHIRPASLAGNYVGA